MIYDYSETPVNNTVGAFSESSNVGFAQTLHKLNESFHKDSLNYNSDISSILKYKSLADKYKEILLEDYAIQDEGNVFHNLNVQKVEQLYENSKNAILSEAGIGSLNPVVGLTLPLLKINWITCMMKDYVPTEVAITPVIKIGIERLYLKDSDGVKHYLPEAFKESPDKLLGAVRKKLTDTKITVPQLSYDVLTQSGGSIKQADEIGTDFCISTLYLKDNGGKEIEIKNLRIEPDPGTGVFSQPIDYKENSTEIKDMINGQINYETGILSVGSISGKVTGIKVFGHISSENNLRSASTGWDKELKQFVIPNGIHLNTGITEERLKDESIIYKIDTAAKAVTDMSRVLTEICDIDILRFLNESKERLAGTPVYQKAIFDCLPPSDITLGVTPMEWRRSELKETMNNMAISLRKILRTQNCYFAVIGNPIDVNLLQDVNWHYGKNQEVGGITLDYNFGVYNTDHKFLILSSDRMPEGVLKMIAVPTNKEHITYKHFEYSFIISNSYRDPNNPNVPSVMTTKRYLTDEVTPVQGEIYLLNNTLSVSEAFENRRKQNAAITTGGHSSSSSSSSKTQP